MISKENIEDLGIDPDNFHWESLAYCSGSPANLFFDWAEKDAVVREQVESICSICPVQKACNQTAIDEKRVGFWGGKHHGPSK